MDLLRSYADLLLSYAEDDIDRNDSDPSSPPRLLLAKSSCPSVDYSYTALALSCATYNQTLSRPIDPTQHSIAFNPTYDQLWTPNYGPAHPFSSSGLPQGLRSTSSFLFDEQYNTFQVFGDASDPSAPSANAPVGDLEALRKNLSLSVYNLPPSVHKRQHHEQKTPHAEDDQEDSAEEEERVELENPAIDAWLSKNKKSPWSGKREELQTELTVEQKKYAEEHSVVSLPRSCGGDEGHIISSLIPTRQRQPTPLVGWRGFFWDLDGRRPEGKVIWRLHISFGERSPKVFNTYYTVSEYEVQECGAQTGAEPEAEVGAEAESEDGDGNEEVDQDAVDEACGIDLHDLNVTWCLTEEKFNFLLFDLLEFIRSFTPPATIVFVSGNAGFAPFLRKVKEKGYLVLVISESECASSAFQDAGLTLYDWIPAIHGEGFFPSEERDLRDYASFSEEAH